MSRGMWCAHHVIGISRACQLVRELEQAFPLQVKLKPTNKDEEKRMCLAMVQSLKLQERQYRLGSSLILLKREVVDEMEKKRGLLLVEYAITLQRTVRRYVSLSLHEKKKDLRRNFQSILKLQSIFRRSMARPKYAKILEAVQQSKKRMSMQSGDSNNSPETAVDAALTSLLAENTEKKVLYIHGLADQDNNLHLRCLCVTLLLYSQH
jgi:myosin heavy subunit